MLIKRIAIPIVAVTSLVLSSVSAADEYRTITRFDIEDRIALLDIDDKEFFSFVVNLVSTRVDVVVPIENGRKVSTEVKTDFSVIYEDVNRFMSSIMGGNQ